MKKIFFIFLLAVIGLTAKSFGQGTCSSAQQIYVTDTIQSQTLQVNDSVYWLKFTASDTTLFFYLTKSDTTVISNIFLYHANDGCNSYTNIDQDFGDGYINYENLIINDFYFIKITQNNTLYYNIYYSNKEVGTPISLGASLASVVTFNSFSPPTYSTYYNNITCWTSEQQDNCELIKVCTNVNFYIKKAAPSTDFVLPQYPFRYEFKNASTNAIFYKPSSSPTSVTTSNITEPISLSIATPGKYYVKLISYGPNGPIIQIGNNNEVYITVEENTPNSSGLNIPSPACIGDNLILCSQYPDNTVTWTFGGDISPSFGNPPGCYTYYCNCPGTYNFWATATNVCGVSDPTNYTLVVSSQPKIESQIIPHICNDFQFYGESCINESTPQMFSYCTWQWDFGDGGTSNLQNPTHAYSIAGVYTVTFSITYDDPACNGSVTESVTESITVNPLPKPIITGPNNNCNSFDEANLSKYSVSPYGSDYTYSWDLTNGNGTISSSLNNHTAYVIWNTTLNGPAVIAVTLTDTNNCIGTAYDTIFPCCRSGKPLLPNLHNGTYKPSQIPTSSEFYINGIVTITYENGNNNAVFNNQTVYLGPNAQIIVAPNTNLAIKQSSLSAGCKYMWDGIYVNDKNFILDVSYSTIKEAINGLVSDDDGIITIKNSNMSNNYYNVKISNSTATSYQGSIKETTFTGSNLTLDPLVGTKTLVGVYCDSINSITIGDDGLSSYKNTFSDMQYGIYAFNSNINVYNNLFEKIKNGGITPPFHISPPYFEGAIYAMYQQYPPISPLIITNPKTLTVGGDKLKQNYFNNCNTGIFSFRYINNIINNNIEDSYNGISLVNTVSAIHAHNNIIVPTSNINDNVIYGSITDQVTPGKGISVWNTHSTYGYNCTVKGNNITNKQTGISMIGVNSTTTSTTVNNNYIHFNLPDPYAVTSLNECGISASNCDRIDISFNTINRHYPIVDDNNDYNFIKGISVQGKSISANVFQNHMTFMGNGIYTSGILTNTQFNCNNLDHNYWGFRFAGASQISNQGQSSVYNPCNIWSENVPQPPLHYRLYDQGLNGSFFYYYDQNANSMYDPHPYFPTSGNITSVNNPDVNCLCVDNGGSGTIPYGSLYPINNASTREMALGQIVRNQLVFDTLQAEYTAMANEYAYKLLTNDSTIIYMGDTSDNVYIAFYNTMQSSDAAHTMNAIEAMYEGALDVAQGELDQISDTNTINDNRISVDNIYLNTWASNIYQLNDDQINKLIDIAYSDPNTNGDAVYTARVMLNIDPTDIGLDYAKPPYTKPQATLGNTVKVYPNPANTQFTIAFKDVMNSNAIVELYGSMGNLVLTDYMQKDTYIKNIDVSKLNSGLYFYNISINGAKVSSGKLTILNN